MITKLFENEKDLNYLLDKISKNGYDSLSDYEKDFLKNYKKDLILKKPFSDKTYEDEFFKVNIKDIIFPKDDQDMINFYLIVNLKNKKFNILLSYNKETTAYSWKELNNKNDFDKIMENENYFYDFENIINEIIGEYENEYE